MMVDGGPRAIETIYNGYRFRSRLEARWAVFMDAIGVAYQYELEGFKLSSGKLYLPDFYLPTLNTWLEVKGEWEVQREDETWCKARDLALDMDERVCVFVGQFDSASSLYGWEFCGTEDESTGHEPLRVWWFRCPMCSVWQTGRTVAELPCDCLLYWPGEQPELVRAVLRAKQARFEFGESG